MAKSALQSPASSLGVGSDLPAFCRRLFSSIQAYLVGLPPKPPGTYSVSGHRLALELVDVYPLADPSSSLRTKTRPSIAF